jgi:hypothetical protein
MKFKAALSAPGVLLAVAQEITRSQNFLEAAG